MQEGSVSESVCIVMLRVLGVGYRRGIPGIVEVESDRETGKTRKSEPLLKQNGAH